MSKVKFILGLIVAVGLPLAAATGLATATYSYAHQHVHERKAVSDTTVRVHDYYHSTAGVIGCGVGYGIIFLLFTFLCVWLGGAMIVHRHSRWD